MLIIISRVTQSDVGEYVRVKLSQQGRIATLRQGGNKNNDAATRKRATWRANERDNVRIKQSGIYSLRKSVAELAKDRVVSD